MPLRLARARLTTIASGLANSIAHGHPTTHIVTIRTGSLVTSQAITDATNMIGV